MITLPEHRECRRSPIHARTEVRLRNGIVVEGEAKDISLHGLMFHSQCRLPVGKPVRVRLIPDQSESANCRHINAGGFVARLHDNGVAVCFTDIDAEGQQYLCDEVLQEAPPAI